MESFQDDIDLPIPKDLPSPIYKRKLIRLKKASSLSITADNVRFSDDPIVPIQDSNASASSEPINLENEKNFDSGFDPIVERTDSSVFESKGFVNKEEFEDDIDPLFSVSAIDEGFETLDLDLKTERQEEKEKPVKRRLNLDEGSEYISKKKRKTKSKLGEKPKEYVGEKMSEKERKAQLEQIHADYQRLLRETRDASFKLVPFVQMPISSVLEKMRQRKFEVLKQTSILCQSDSVSTSDYSMDELAQKNSDTVRIQNDAKDIEKDAKVDDFVGVQAVERHAHPQDPCGEIPRNDASEMDVKDASHTPLNGNMKATNTFLSSSRDGNQLDKLEDNLNLPLPTSILNHAPDDISSEEEEDGDKENIDPRPSIAVNMDSSPEAGIAKAFLDDEAEEEDDSDHDLMRFQDYEEEDESDADEVLNDLIATGYEEAPIDHEKRNQLHQKWLEQQDAVGTDDILQRLKYGKKQIAPTCLHDEDEDEDEFDEESADEQSYDLPVPNVARQNSKKAKQMIAQMFNDTDDTYVASDDEEAEQALVRQRILKQTDASSLISPVEDEHSREVFGLIKKLNIAPLTKKRGKTVTSSFDSLMMGGNINSSSKSSFLNRTSILLPSSHRQASTTVRAFIFGRDDSSSRSGISTSESISDMDLKEHHASKLATSKSKVSSNSQIKSAAKTKIESNSGSASGSSLFQILRHSSMHFDKQFSKKSSGNQEITETQAAYQFSAFKLGKRVAKVESRI